MGERRWLDPQPLTLRVFDSDGNPALDASDGRRGLSAEMTLTEFCEEFVWPVYWVSNQLSPLTREGKEGALKLWVRFTGDPPLRDLEVDRGGDYVVSQFLAGLYAMARSTKLRRQQELAEREKREFRKLLPEELCSPATIDTKCRAIQLLLNIAGPRTREHPLAQRLISEVPYIPKPTLDSGDEHSEETFTLEEMGQILAAAPKMDWPCWPGIPPAAWWDSLIRVAYNTSERRGALLGVKLPAVDAATIVFTRWIRKGKKKTNVLPINAACRAAIERIRTPRELLFPIPGVGFPRCRRWFHTNWGRLLEHAQIPPERRFGPHGLRRSTATEVALQDGEQSDAVQLLLAHSNPETKKAYEHKGRIATKRQQVLKAKLDNLPQPILPGMGDPQLLLF
jgi:integrase